MRVILLILSILFSSQVIAKTVQVEMWTNFNGEKKI
mgnify:FL=1